MAEAAGCELPQLLFTCIKVLLIITLQCVCVCVCLRARERKLDTGNILFVLPQVKYLRQY